MRGQFNFQLVLRFLQPRSQPQARTAALRPYHGGLPTRPITVQLQIFGTHEQFHCTFALYGRRREEIGPGNTQPILMPLAWQAIHRTHE